MKGAPIWLVWSTSKDKREGPMRLTLHAVDTTFDIAETHKRMLESEINAWTMGIERVFVEERDLDHAYGASQSGILDEFQRSSEIAYWHRRTSD